MWSTMFHSLDVSINCLAFSAQQFSLSVTECLSQLCCVMYHGPKLNVNQVSFLEPVLRLNLEATA